MPYNRYNEKVFFPMYFRPNPLLYETDRVRIESEFSETSHDSDQVQTQISGEEQQVPKNYELSSASVWEPYSSIDKISSFTTKMVLISVPTFTMAAHLINYSHPILATPLLIVSLYGIFFARSQKRNLVSKILSIKLLLDNPGAVEVITGGGSFELQIDQIKPLSSTVKHLDSSKSRFDEIKDPDFQPPLLPYEQWTGEVCKLWLRSRRINVTSMNAAKAKNEVASTNERLFVIKSLLFINH